MAAIMRIFTQNDSFRSQLRQIYPLVGDKNVAQGVYFWQYMVYGGDVRCFCGRFCYPNVTTLRSGLCYRNTVCRLSVCNVGAPYSGG